MPGRPGEPPLILGVDVGTHAARAGLFDTAGTLLAVRAENVALHRPAEKHAVYVMDEIWRAVGAAVRAALASIPEAGRSLAGIAFDATSSLVLNADGAPPLAGGADVFCWMDHRAAAEAVEITATGDRFLRTMGGTLSPEMHLPKLLWLKRHDPGAWARLWGVRDLCDELARRATGSPHHSLCGLACKWAYLPDRGEGWRQGLLERLGIADLPRLGSLATAPRAVGSRHGVLEESAARELGLAVGLPVAVGLIDAEAGMLGTLGAEFPRHMNATAAVIGGTSTCLMALAPEERVIPGVWGPFKDALFPGLWLHEAGQSLSGAALDAVLVQHPAGPHHAGARMHASTIAEILDTLEKEGPAFAAGRHIVPDWLGNRSPFGRSEARAMMSGIGTEVTHRSFLETYYATARALVLQLRQIVAHMNGFGYAISRAVLSGGHLKNALMRRLYRDALGAQLVTVRAPEPVLLGTAMVAAVGAGLFPDLSTAIAEMSAARDEPPADPRWREAHAAAYRAYEVLSEASNRLACDRLLQPPLK